MNRHAWAVSVLAIAAIGGYLAHRLAGDDAAALWFAGCIYILLATIAAQGRLR